MSYGRDRDAASRGAGAIASRDFAHPNAARARLRARVAATARRDRAMAGLTYGARGGLALGAISKTRIAGAITPTLRYGGVLEAPANESPGVPLPPPSGKGVTPTILPVPPKPTTPIPPPPTSPTGGRITTVKPPSMPATSWWQPSQVKPLPTPTAPPVVNPAITTSTGGGKTTGTTVVSGGGAGIVTGGSSTPPVPELPEDPETPIPEVEAAPAKKMSTGLMIAIGVAIGGAILLLKDRD